ncbi:unnamed protein product [Vitrella brassicaformis CCMP3155]|uniref:Protein kinase domain-containing protein n=2 Tax=Vitrella brassicaformis TaxID=1169539 RepID=A0A0G4F917_VITBC|nr:unnamed protein product [Vitrella brassicaformis CCMP3155]|mmetsp:Transcript_15809/g.45054  ORF Transcript_15809/g.45054 Transcript_15809/m.45054 type:complete len:725 (-) Transcript_15809:16-2190(-)|eukprot:CEM08830.1 unnamed protein product [Vitrella brassicaformis CCMP3155]
MGNETSQSAKRVITYNNGDRYHGESIQRLRHGYGIYQYRIGDRYEGEWFRDRKHGYGTFFLANGDVYSGQWNEDRRHGRGISIHANWDRYEGEYRNDLRCGWGMLAEQSGTFYGQFRDNVKHGHGVHLSAAGDVFGETWHSGERKSRTPLEQMVPFPPLPSSAHAAKAKGAAISGTAPCSQSSGRLSPSQPQSQSAAATLPSSTLRRVTPSASSSRHQNDADASPSETVGQPLKPSAHDQLAEGEREGEGGVSEASPDERNGVDGSTGEEQSESAPSPPMDARDTGAQPVPREQQEREHASVASVVSTTASSHTQPHSSIVSWTVGEVCRWLSLLGLGHLTSRFIEHHITGQELFDLTDSELIEELGIDKLAHRQILLQASQNLMRYEVKRQAKKIAWTDIIEDRVLRPYIIPHEQLKRLKMIGEGGFGRVYLGEWAGNEVALKEFRRTGIEEARVLREFATEVSTLAQLRHPNIALFMGICVEAKYQCIVSEYVGNGSLFDLLHRRHQKLQQLSLLQICQGICSAMAYLHGLGIIHCDLKSSNILLDYSLNPKLCDFGLALNLLRQRSSKHRGRVGTPHWMAPEVLRGAECTPAADVYSFGILLWEMLGVKIPYVALSVPQIVAAVGWGKKTPGSLPDAPRRLSIIMRACMNDDPSKRPDFKKLLNVFGDMLEECCDRRCSVDQAFLDGYGNLEHHLSGSHALSLRSASAMAAAANRSSLSVA